MSKLDEIIAAIVAGGNGSGNGDGGSGGGTAVQGDWNQNDPTAADYIKNRPFYEGDPELTILMDETTLEFYGGESDLLPEVSGLLEGAAYTVTWDGIDYECLCQTVELDGTTTRLIGNPAFFGMDDSGEPFMCVVAEGMSMWMTSSGASYTASHTASIRGIVREIVKIPRRFIEEARTSYSPFNNYLHSGNGNIVITDIPVDLFRSSFNIGFIQGLRNDWKVSTSFINRNGVYIDAILLTRLSLEASKTGNMIKSLQNTFFEEDGVVKVRYGNVISEVTVPIPIFSTDRGKVLGVTNGGLAWVNPATGNV